MKKKREEVNENKTIAPEIIRTILQDGVDFEVTVRRKTVLHKLKILPASRTFMIYPINLGTLFTISKIIITMKEMEALEGEDLFSAGIKTIKDNKNKMLEIVAYGILNHRVKGIFDLFTKWRLMRFLNNNLDSGELLKLVNLIIAQMDVTNFLASFVSVKRKMNLVAEAKKEISLTTGKSSEE